jgi:hypothetical protein
MSDNNIRFPDNPIIERLVIKSLEEEEFDKILLASAEEYENKQIQKIIDEFDKIENRRKQFINILFILQRLSHYDTKALQVYNILEPIINNYINYHFETYTIDKNIYDNIFDIIKTTRITQAEIELLTKIFIPLEKV